MEVSSVSSPPLEDLYVDPRKEVTAGDSKPLFWAAVFIALTACLPFLAAKKKRTIMILPTGPDHLVALLPAELAPDPFEEQEGQKKAVQELFSTLANHGAMSLGLKRTYLENLGTLIDEKYKTHPLLFLLLAEKEDARKILTNQGLAYKNFVFPTFIGNIQENLQRAQSQSNFSSLLDTFAEKMEKDKEETRRLFAGISSQEGCMQFLLFLYGSGGGSNPTA